MSSDPASDRDASADGYLRRAELLADLGRYDDAATELGFALALDPGDAAALLLLARVHLAAGRPTEALAAAESAAAVAAGVPEPLVIQGFALADLRRFAEAARTAEELLELGPSDPYAQRNAAAILGESRNGQRALNAAWRGVELVPEEPEGHLVLGLVAARLDLFDLAERAYREALRLDPDLASATEDVGVIGLERRRHAAALERLAAVAPVAPGRPAPAREPARAPAARTIRPDLRRLVRYGGGYGIVTVLLVALLAAGNPTISRVWAALMAVAGAALGWRLIRQRGRRAAIPPGLLRSDPPLALALGAVAAAPCLILLYAFVGTAWPLVLTVGTAAVAQLAVLRRTVT